jgi:hypothetical protein
MESLADPPAPGSEARSGIKPEQFDIVIKGLEKVRSYLFEDNHTGGCARSPEVTGGQLAPWFRAIHALDRPYRNV